MYEIAVCIVLAYVFTHQHIAASHTMHRHSIKMSSLVASALGITVAWPMLRAQQATQSKFILDRKLCVWENILERPSSSQNPCDIAVNCTGSQHRKPDDGSGKHKVVDANIIVTQNLLEVEEFQSEIILTSAEKAPEEGSRRSSRAGAQYTRRIAPPVLARGPRPRPPPIKYWRFCFFIFD